MARDNETNTLELHIKVNGQNLSAISEKCNIGTLRIPSDPSWPKIPPRSSKNTDDIIEPPCVVTLTGTPRKGHGLVQTVTCQHLQSRLSQQYEATTHLAKRPPSCFDPRFRRQILRQKAEKPDEFCNTKNNKQTTELKTHVSQETENLEDKSREKADESVDAYIPLCHDVDNLLSSVGKSTKKAMDYPANEQPILEATHPSTLQHVAKERHDVGNRFPQEEKQESNRPLLLMVDEKKIHALPIDTLNVEAASSPAQSLQCYSVQIPVIAYRDVPLQVSSMPTQIEKDVKIPSVCKSDCVRETVGNICTRSTNSTCSSGIGDSRNEKHPLDSIQRGYAKNSDDICISRNKSTSKHCEVHTAYSDRMYDKENDLNVESLKQDVTNEITLNKDHYGNFDALDNAINATKNRSYSNLNAAAKLKNFVDQSCMIGFFSTADRCKEKKMSNERNMAKPSMQKLAYYVKDKRDNSSINVIDNKMLEKNMQSFASGEVCNISKENSKSNEEMESKKEKDREQRFNVKRKTTPVNLSRKAKSFFQKKSRLAITDSDCTLILPGYRYVKGKRHEKSRGHSKVSLSLHERNGINSMNPTLVKYNASKQGRISSRLLTNLRAGNSFENPSFIPLETQERLNKSYWEYYWELKRKIASAKPDNTTEERGECSKKNHLPESQTLRQCSVLSCMINTALRDSATADEGPVSSDPAANVTPNARESVHQASELSSELAKKIKRRRMERASKRLLGLRVIALLCITLYVAVIFLPMMYEYFFAMEYEDENLNYIELMFRYVASSFEEALDGFIDILTTILLRPVRSNRKQ